MARAGAGRAGSMDAAGAKARAGVWVRMGSRGGYDSAMSGRISGAMMRGARSGRRCEDMTHVHDEFKMGNGVEHS